MTTKPKTPLEHALEILEAEGYAKPAAALESHGRDLWAGVAINHSDELADRWVGVRFHVAPALRMGDPWAEEP